MYCIYCKRKLKKPSRNSRGRTKTIDHIVPKSKGGNNSDYNKVPCCAKCNINKNSLTLEEWKKQLQITLHSINRLLEITKPFKDRMYKHYEFD